MWGIVGSFGCVLGFGGERFPCTLLCMINFCDPVWRVMLSIWSAGGCSISRGGGYLSSGNALCFRLWWFGGLPALALWRRGGGRFSQAVVRLGSPFGSMRRAAILVLSVGGCRPSRGGVPFYWVWLFLWGEKLQCLVGARSVAVTGGQGAICFCSGLFSC